MKKVKMLIIIEMELRAEVVIEMKIVMGVQMLIVVMEAVMAVLVMLLKVLQQILISLKVLIMRASQNCRSLQSHNQVKLKQTLILIIYKF